MCSNQASTERESGTVMHASDPSLPRNARGNEMIALTTTINNPKMWKLNAVSIRLFLRKYEAYKTEIQARALQLGSSANTYSIQPIHVKYCMDTQMLQSALDLQLIPNATRYKALTEDCLLDFLESEAEYAQTMLSLSDTANIVSSSLRMDMKNKCAKSRMQNLFIDYNSILRRHGISDLL